MLSKHILNIWLKTEKKLKLSLAESFCFSFLLFIEPLYKFCFFINKLYRKHLVKTERFSFKVISVGNISVGGTGKSVLTRFIISSLNSSFQGAVAIRGYKSSVEKGNESLLVSDGK